MPLGLRKKGKATTSSSELDTTGDDFTEKSYSFREPKKLRSSARQKPSQHLHSSCQSSDKAVKHTQGVQNGHMKEKDLVNDDKFCTAKHSLKIEPAKGPSSNHSKQLCPICSKLLTTVAQRSAHIKKCAVENEVTPENAIKLLRGEKTDENGHNILPAETVAYKPKQSKSSKDHDNLELSEDMELAMALSISMCEKEQQNLVEQENEILELGMADLIEEQRLVIEPTAPVRSMQVKITRVPKKRKKRKLEKNTRLTTMTQQERETIMSERVALILSSDDPVIVPCTPVTVNGPLCQYVDESCSLWHKSSATGQDLASFYVPELEKFIRPSDIAIGGMLQRYSQVPGRLNFTRICQGGNESGSDCDIDSSIVDGYSTQLYLAELLGSQNLPEMTLDDEGSHSPWTPSGFEEISTLGREALKIEDKTDHLHEPTLVIDSGTLQDNFPAGNTSEVAWTKQDDKDKRSSIDVTPLKSKNSSSQNCDSSEVKSVEANNEESLNAGKPNCITGLDLSEDWGRIYSSGEHSDLTIKTNGRDIPVHSLVLLARCREILLDKSTSNVIDWSCFSSEAVSMFLNWLYTGNWTLSDEALTEEILHLTTKYHCNHLKSLIEEYVLSKSDGRHQKSLDLTPDKFSLKIPMPSSPDIFGEYDDGEPSYFHSRHTISPPLSLSLDQSLINNSAIRRQLTYNSPEVHKSELSNREETDVVDLTQSSPEEEKSPEKDPSDHAVETCDPAADLDYVENCAYNSGVWDDFDDQGLHTGHSSSYLVIHSPSTNNAVSESPETRKTSEQKDTKSMRDSLGDSTLMEAVCSFEETARNQTIPQTTASVISAKPSVSLTPATPVTRFQQREQNQVTPMPPFKSMVTPELKKALDKYGLRQMSRNKAIKLLVHIYEEMHPLVTDSEASFCETPKPSRSKERKTLNYSEKISMAATKPEITQDKVLNSSQSSQSSVDDSKDEMQEESMLMMETESDKDEEVCSSQQAGMNERIMAYIKCEENLYQKILVYEPIWFSELLANLKNSGIKCTQQKLLDFLDEQCITFRFSNEGKSRRKPRKRKNSNSPGKKKVRRTKS